MNKKTRAVTDAQITAWKKEHGDLREISVEQDGETFTAVVRKPNLDDILMSEEYGQGDIVKQNLFLYKNCYLGGDAKIGTDDELRFAVANEIAKLFRVLKTAVKKL